MVHAPTLETAWEFFMHAGGVDRQQVRPPILKSWIRCRKRALDPLTLPQPRVLKAEELDHLRQENQELLVIAAPFICDLAHIVRGSGFLVVLTDPAGRILATEGDSSLLANSRLARLAPGYDWSEEAAGTNAMGLALYEREPVQVLGCEHYLKAFHELTCSAAPILDPLGRLIGVMNMSGPHEEAHAHTLGMVVAAVRAIERQISLVRSTDLVRSTNRVLDVVLNAIQDGVLVVTTDGSILRWNKRAENLLGLEEAREELNLLRLLHDQVRMVQQLTSGSSFDDEEVLLTARGRTRRFVISGKPVQHAGEAGRHLLITLRPVEEINRLVHRFRGHHSRFTLDDMVGTSQPMLNAKKAALRAATGDLTVLIMGESGTGKELLAHGIHKASGRANGPFVALNCSAIPRSLLESELFGYESGAFTGAASKGRPGKFELADGGTLFLDEIGDMPLEMQAALLRVLQDNEVVRLGSTRPTQVNVRVITATNKDLHAEVKAGNFRPDLLYRLDVLTITLPPLRERASDIPLLVEHYLARKGLPSTYFTKEAMRMLQEHTWPGNVRELENVIEKCLTWAEDDQIAPQHLPPTLQLGTSSPATLPPDGEPAPQRGAQSAKSMEELERESILQALHQYHGNLSRAAKALGISRPTLYRKLRIYHLSDQRYR